MDFMSHVLISLSTVESNTTQRRLSVPRTDFSGGKTTVKPKLESMGYIVVSQRIDDSLTALPEEVPEDLWEGAKRAVKVNAFERNADARLACIEHHGTKCIACGFDFGEAYGEEFAGLIHVHHLIPLSDIGERYKIDPIKDLVPVCANCHAIIHSLWEPHSVGGRYARTDPKCHDRPM
jgi:predicted HNH restriction endonuclease